MRFSGPLSFIYLVFVGLASAVPAEVLPSSGIITPEISQRALEYLSKISLSNTTEINSRSFTDFASSPLSFDSFEKRDGTKIQASTSCRTANYEDYNGLSDAQFAVFIQKLDTIFDYVIVGSAKISQEHMVRDKGSYNGAEIGPLSSADEDNGADNGIICLDGSRVRQSGYSENSDDCFGSSFTARTTTDHSTESLKQQSIDNTVSITINPPAGYQCNLKISQRSCPGTLSLSIPYTFKNSIRVNFDDRHCLNPNIDPGCSKGSHYFWYIPLAWLLSGSPDTLLTQTIKTAVTSTGQYSQQCFPSDQSTPSNGGSISTAYQPNISCPKNLDVVKNACSANIGDYLGDGTVTGDTSAWKDNKGVFTQSPGAQSSVSYGQTNVDFSIKTPYHEAQCSALLQVVPPWASTFLPETPILQYPQDGSTLSSGYTVGYVSKCDDSQFGTCQIKNIESRNAASSFQFRQTSPKGNPIQVFDLSNSGQQWPETDRLTFTLTCKDVYGNSGEVQNYQDVVRGDIKTETITAQTSTFTVHSTTKYLFTSVQTYFTSVVTPVVTATLKTATLYTDTIYTSTATLTGFRAAELTKTERFSTTKTLATSKFKTSRPTVTPSVSLTTLTSTRKPKTTSVSTITNKKWTSTLSLTQTKTKTSTVFQTPKPTACSQSAASPVVTPASNSPLGASNERRKVLSTTTTTDLTGTQTATDYINTFQNDVSSTTIVTDYTAPAFKTLSTTSTIFDPYGTQITSGIFYGVSTTILGSYTTTTSTTSTILTTSTITKTKSLPTTLKAQTSTFSTVATQFRTSIIYTTVPKKTVTSTVSTKTKTITVTSTLTPACTKA